jgi:DNA-binding transcriptional LysR family regulator
MDTLAAMRIFATVVEAGSFARAAERLDLAKSVVSKHVAALEAHLGVRLLNRTTRRLSLTEAGAAYVERSRELLAEIEALEASVGDMVERPRGLLRINAPVTFGVMHLGAALAAYGRLYPDVRVDLSLSDRIVDLVEEGYDLAVRIAPGLESTLVARRLATTRGVLCASPDYLARRGTPKRPDDLRAHDCLGYSYSSSGDTWRMEGPDGPVAVRLSWTMSANNGDVLVAAAVAGAGILLEPGFIVAPAIAAGRLVPLLTDHRFTEYGIYALYPHRKHLSAKVRTMVDFLVDRFAGGL